MKKLALALALMMLALAAFGCASLLHKRLPRKPRRKRLLRKKPRRKKLPLKKPRLRKLPRTATWPTFRKRAI